jgi:FG-GAP-like repeat/FG-GAP repeat
MRLSSLTALALLANTFSLSSQVLVKTHEGTADYENFGTASSGLGDINGDGVGDYIVGANRLPPLTTVPGFATVYSGTTHLVIYTVTGAAAGDGFGSSVGDAGDVNKDGTADFIVGATEFSLGNRRGYVQVFSGKTGNQIYKINGTSNGDLHGWNVTGVGDLNKDGFDDFAASSPGATTVNSQSQSVTSGKVVIYSGKDALILATLKSETAGDRYGEALASIGDTDNDTYPDILVGLPGIDTGGTDVGSARLISGRLFTVLQTLNGTSANDNFGTSLCSIGDINGDNRPDFVVGSRYGNYARVYSGANGTTIRTHTGSASSDMMGQSVAGPGDLDGDGKPDVLVGAFFPPPFGHLINAGYVRAFSGSNGNVLFTRSGSTNGDYYGSSVAGIGDNNRDGVPDFLIGARGAQNSSSKASGIAEVHSGVGATLDRGTVTTISLAAGGTQTLSIDVGATRGAGKSYLVLGSLSGSTPGFAFNNLLVPIKFDIYTSSLLTSINQIPLLGALGALNTQGRGTAQFVIPAGFPAALAGLELTHAFITADPVVQVPVFASNAVTVKLTL